MLVVNCQLRNDAQSTVEGRLYMSLASTFTHCAFTILVDAASTVECFMLVALCRVG